jgi:hypothetical protein
MSRARSASLKPATYADLERIPEHLVAEILDGELHTSPRPRARHAMAASEIGSTSRHRSVGSRAR